MFDVISWLDENETRSRILSTSLAVVVGVDKIYTLREDCLLSMLKSYMEIGHFRLLFFFFLSFFLVADSIMIKQKEILHLSSSS